LALTTATFKRPSDLSTNISAQLSHLKFAFTALFLTRQGAFVATKVRRGLMDQARTATHPKARGVVEV
jgi:hypothetical protein